jgi:hypothetical protein
MHSHKLVERCAKFHDRFWPGLCFATISPGDTRSGPTSVQVVPGLKLRLWRRLPPLQSHPADCLPSWTTRRRKFLRHSLQLLHLSEFILLIEFTES